MVDYSEPERSDFHVTLLHSYALNRCATYISESRFYCVYRAFTFGRVKSERFAVWSFATAVERFDSGVVQRIEV